MKFNFKASWQVNANMCRNIKLINGGSFYQGEKEIIFYNNWAGQPYGKYDMRKIGILED